MNQKIKTILKSVFVLALFAVSVQLVLGIDNNTPPPDQNNNNNPPSGNVVGPLNTGLSNQTKVGGLSITGGTLEMTDLNHALNSVGPAWFQDTAIVGSAIPSLPMGKFEVNMNNSGNYFRVNPDDNVGLELRSGTTHGTPYIDFSNKAASGINEKGSGSDFDMRLILDQDDLLKIEGGWLSVSGLAHTPASGTTETPLCARENGDIKVCGTPDTSPLGVVKVCVGYDHLGRPVSREEILDSSVVATRATCKNWVNANIDIGYNPKYLALGCKIGTNSTTEGAKMSTFNYENTPTPEPNLCGWEELVVPPPATKVCVRYDNTGRNQTITSGVILTRDTCKNWAFGFASQGNPQDHALGCDNGTTVVEGAETPANSNPSTAPAPSPNCGWDITYTQSPIPSTYTSSGTFTLTSEQTVYVKVWGAAGGGGGSQGGVISPGGGGGGFSMAKYTLGTGATPTSPINYTVTVGAGGAGGAGSATICSSPNTTDGSPGGASQFSGSGVSVLSGGGDGGVKRCSNSHATGGAGGNADSVLQYPSWVCPAGQPAGPFTANLNERKGFPGSQGCANDEPTAEKGIGGSTPNKSYLQSHSITAGSAGSGGNSYMQYNNRNGGDGQNGAVVISYTAN